VREPVAAVGLRDRRRRRARAGARRGRAAPGGRPGPGERSRLLRASLGHRALLPARGVRRAAAGSPAAALQEGTLTVTVGLPGTGIGGIFYLASALVMPFREVYRRLRGRPAGDWRVVTGQLAITGGVLGGMWVTGRLLGLALAAARPIGTAGRALPPGNVLRFVSTALAFGTLAAVLAAVELLRLWVHRGKRPARRVRQETSLSHERSVVQQWRRVASLVVLAVIAAPVSLAQSPRRPPVRVHLARADSAWAARAEIVAAREYAAVLAADPENSHATYRLAQLTRDDLAALRLFQRYVELSPRIHGATWPWARRWPAPAGTEMRSARTTTRCGSRRASPKPSPAAPRYSPALAPPRRRSRRWRVAAAIRTVTRRFVSAAAPSSRRRGRY